MGNEVKSGSRYALSFTSGALLVREAVTVAPVYLSLRSWTAVRETVLRENLLQARTATSSARVVLEVVKRLATLTVEDLELLLDATPSERGHLLWVAACRQYGFIGEFAEEVLRERFLLLKPNVKRDDFDAFVRTKALWHPELNEIADSTFKKLRSTLFLMMAEAGFLSENGTIVPAVLSDRVLRRLAASTPSDVRFIPATAQWSGGAAL